jgi:hypothetical protein
LKSINKAITDIIIPAIRYLNLLLYGMVLPTRKLRSVVEFTPQIIDNIATWKGTGEDIPDTCLPAGMPEAVKTGNFL